MACSIHLFHVGWCYISTEVSGLFSAPGRAVSGAESQSYLHQAAMAISLQSTTASVAQPNSSKPWPVSSLKIFPFWLTQCQLSLPSQGPNSTARMGAALARTWDNLPQLAQNGWWFKWSVWNYCRSHHGRAPDCYSWALSLALSAGHLRSCHSISPKSITAQASPAGLCTYKQHAAAAPWPQAYFFVQILLLFY